MLKTIILAQAITLLLGQSFAADQFSTWNYDCINCVVNKGYFCDYSKTYNSGSCSSSSFTLCTTQYTSVTNNGCVDSFGSEKSLEIRGDQNQITMINGATIYMDGL